MDPSLIDLYPKVITISGFLEYKYISILISV
jgi:hypothetical protein